MTAVALAAAVAGCAGAGESLSQFKMSSATDLFTIKAPDSSVLPAEDAGLGRRGAVAAEQLVDAGGRCVADAPTGTDGQAGVEATASPIAGSAPAAPSTPAAPVAANPADPSLPPLIGGVGLGMTECEVVRRAGQPTNVTISADANNDRLAVLTYLGGNFPGIYRFAAGRLKVIDRAPEPPKPERPVRRARKKTATR
ncbi:MAG: hypothetical protein AB7O50_14820 [Pseudolabrys sp.]